MKTETIDLSTDPRAEKLRRHLAVFVEAFKELESLPADFPLYETKYAAILLYGSRNRCPKKVEELVQARAEWLLQFDLAKIGEITVRENDNGNLQFYDGTHRSAVLTMRGLPIPATLEPRFEDIFK